MAMMMVMVMMAMIVMAMVIDGDGKDIGYDGDDGYGIGYDGDGYGDDEIVHGARFATKYKKYIISIYILL